MTLRKKVLWATISAICILIVITTAYVACQKFLSLPFRHTNDILHEQKAPVTLDFLIPAGTHIHEKMTVQEVIRLRFQRPTGTITLFVAKIAENVPMKYRIGATAALYLFWTFLFLIFFRVFTWMGYGSALRMSFLCGAGVYYFMPDFVTGRIDDAAFLAWALLLYMARRWRPARRKA